MAFSRSRAVPGSGGNPPAAETGTDLALYTKTLGGVPFPSPARQTWGGARNRRDRVSHALTLKQATNIIEAARYAIRIGLPFNRHITIHWETAGIPDSRAAWATGRYLKLMGDWVAKQGGCIAWVWVRENGDGKGSHTHILVHVPAGLPIGSIQRRWLRRITGKPYKAGTIHTTRIGGTLAAAQAVTEAYLANLGEAVAYVLKGASADSAAALGLDKLEPGGSIIGKRTATSQNLGATARRLAERMVEKRPVGICAGTGELPS
ncbi:hypothetical protein [Emcibacter sp. SYSU 3D8]|uniref:hypothetical protein n=1 Tax=Emcibacter sp. SYSU 3D8 TaxID=3133969 RepID=UPI0031FEB823